MSNKRLLTVGHSTHSIVDFLKLLQKHGVEALCDVRSSPYSQFNPQFNMSALKHSLSKAGILYVYLGDVLGGRGLSEFEYIEDKTSYEHIAQTARFRAGLERLKEAVQDYQLALMCAEKDPIDCHRAILITRNLRNEEIDVAHMHADRSIELNSDFERRLLAKHKLPERDLFSSMDEMINTAYEKQASRISFKRPRDNDLASDNARLDL